MNGQREIFCYSRGVVRITVSPDAIPTFWRIDILYTLAFRERKRQVPADTVKAYCDSMSCPDNRVLIANAHAVECIGGECNVDQCCEAREWEKTLYF